MSRTPERREWDHRLGTAVVQNRSWRVHFMILAALLGGSLIANVSLSSLPRAVSLDARGQGTHRELPRFGELARSVSSDDISFHQAKP